MKLIVSNTWAIFRYWPVSVEFKQSDGSIYIFTISRAFQKKIKERSWSSHQEPSAVRRVALFFCSIKIKSIWSPTIATGAEELEFNLVQFFFVMDTFFANNGKGLRVCFSKACCEEKYQSISISCKFSIKKSNMTHDVPIEIRLTFKIFVYYFLFYVKRLTDINIMYFCALTFHS